MSKHLACQFLYDDVNNLKSDFEVYIDEIASNVGLLRAFLKDEKLQEELTKINTLIYHMISSLRTKVTVTEEELIWLEGRVNIYKEELKERENKFVIPQGSISASYCHIIRTKFNALIRLLFRYKEQGNNVDEILFDFVNLFSIYFFELALKLNKDENIDEIGYVIRA